MFGLTLTAQAQLLKHADMGLMLYDLDAGRAVAESNADVKMTPASVMKLFTTATALEMFGGDYRLTTPVVTTGRIVDRVLEGDVCIIGGLDPTLESAALTGNIFFDSLTVALRRRGIDSIAGAIVADGSIVRREPASPKWVLEDLATYYGVGCYGLSVYDNVEQFHIRAGAEGTQSKYRIEYPAETPYNIIDHAVTVRGDGASLNIYQMPYGSDLLVEGEIGRGVARMEPIAITDPPLFVARRCANLLRTAGIAVRDGGRTARFEPADTVDTLYQAVSPILARIVQEINYRSNNHYAEHIFRLIGTRRTPRGATRADAVSELKRFWSRRGLELGALTMYDGNGLSPMDAASARMVVELLDQMWRGEYAYFFRQSLPECGSEGTVRSLFGRAGFNARAKSGSMSGVQAYAGYITSHGRNYAFAVIVNEFDCSRAALRGEIERTITRQIDKYESTLNRN